MHFDTIFYFLKRLVLYGFSEFFTPFIYGAYYTYALTRLRGAKNIADVATVGAGEPAADRSDRTLIGAGQLVSADSCMRLRRGDSAGDPAPGM